MSPLSDVERCLDMYDALAVAGFDDDLAVVTIPGAPWSKSRPRFGKGRTFTPREDLDAEKRTATYLRQIIRTPHTGNVFIGCLFFRPNRQRIDTDNLVKHVCDAANGVLWKDDSQCTGLMAVLELDVINPRTVVIIGRHDTTLTRGTDATIACQVCGGPIYLDDCRGKPPKTCSPECRLKVPGAPGSLAELVPCLHCKTPFRRRTQAQKLCSERCRYDYLRDKRKGVATFSACQVCGKQLAHRRGGRCRECWKADPKPLYRMEANA
jgi:Holliday junction resolvase RusA-like endonuclease